MRVWSWTEESTDRADYLALVDATRHATAFHEPNWIRAIEKTTNGKVRALWVLDGAEKIAVLPHVHIRSATVSTVFSPPPRTGIQYLGPLFPGLEDLKQEKREQRLIHFAQALQDHLQQTRTRYAQIRMVPRLDDARPFLWSGFDVTPRYTYEIDLESGIDLVWENLKKSVRSDIRRNEGKIGIEWNRPEDFDAVDALLRSRYREQDLAGPLPAGYVARLRETLAAGTVQVITARSGREVIGGLLLLRFRNRMSLWQGAMRGPPGLSVNDILVWEAIRRAAEEHCTSFELMGANTRRLVAFKAKFNPRLVGYLEVTWGGFVIRTLKNLRGSMRSHR